MTCTSPVVMHDAKENQDKQNGSANSQGWEASKIKQKNHSAMKG